MIDALSLPDAADATSALPPLPRKASCPTNAKPDAWCSLRSEFGCAKSKTVRAYCAFTCADARMRGSTAHEQGTNHTHSTSSGGAHAAPGGSGASSEYDKSYLSRLRLSPRGCATVRRLYAEDAALWDRSCGRAAARARPPPAARM